MKKRLTFWITKKDAANMEPGKIVRLMELFNVKIEAATARCS